MSADQDKRTSAEITDQSNHLFLDGYSTDLSKAKNYTQFMKSKLLHRYARPKAVCLDVGVSNGFSALPLASKVDRVVGVDVSFEMLKLCGQNADRAGISNLNLSRLDAANLSFSDHAFDIVYSYATLPIISNVELAYKEVYRVLKPGGIAILDLRGARNLAIGFWRKRFQKSVGLDMHAYTHDGAQSMFEQFGFAVLESYAMGVLDQWKYIPLIRYMLFLDKLVHFNPEMPDLDFKVSQRFQEYAARWYFVLRKL